MYVCMYVCMDEVRESWQARDLGLLFLMPSHAMLSCIRFRPVLYVEFWSRRMQLIKTIDNEMINLIKLHYLLFELHSTRPKFDV